MAIPSRQQALADEVLFWDYWLSTRGLAWPDDYTYRLDPQSQLDRSYWPFIEHVAQDEVAILDVGAGPLTALGKRHPAKRLRIVATDLLAEQYAALLRKHQIDPPVATVFADVERLSEQFEANTFDLIVARNCIDHVSSPLDAIRQMLTVVKQGGYVALFHTENEAERQKYEQLHQWNFIFDYGDFVIRGKNQTFNVSKMLAGLVDVVCILEPPYIKVEMRKR